MSALQDRIEELEEEVRQLRQMIAPASLVDALRASYRLTPQCAQIAALLVRREFVSLDMIDSQLYASRDFPSTNAVHVHISKIRKALPAWAAIKCAWGRGYSMSEETRKRLREELAPVEGLRPAGEAASRVLADLEARRNA